MSYLTWTEGFSVLVKSMDDQHRQLVDLVNQLHDAMRVGKGNEVIGQVLDSLVRYTQTHFAAEEKLMAAHSYPELSQHRAQHESLIQRVADLQKQLRAGKLALSLSTLDFLKKWLVEHIVGSDKSYGVFLSAKGVN